MRKTLTFTIVAALLTTLAVAPAEAAITTSKQEAVGIGTGAVVGAAAGGPIGFIVGAAIGAKIGDNWHARSEQIDTLTSSLEQSNATTVVLERDIDTLTDEISRLRAVARPELVSLLQAGIAMDLLFRTDEAALVDTTGDRLSQLASTLASLPHIRIQLDGFADERGDEDYNLKLSEQRVAFVRDLFVTAGVNPTRISVSAHGESVAQDPSVDSYALERRVTVKLFINESPFVASISD
jgi:outer membrane protein OmpA-like peptidoglycan-associated protein